MFKDNKNRNKINNILDINKQLISNKTSNKYEFKYYSPQKELPPINDNSKISSKIKKSSLTKSINYLFKSLFPEEKCSMDDLLENYSNQFFKKPVWKYTYSPNKGKDKIRRNLMRKNITMKYYNLMRKPTKLKKIKIYKPRMVQIIEDNNLYKSSLYNKPDELYDENSFLNSIKNKLFNGKNNSFKFIIKNDNDAEDYINNEEKKEHIFNNRQIVVVENKNNYRGNISPDVKNKVYLSSINLEKIKEGEEKSIFKNIVIKKQNKFKEKE
jgi:hypothetical protein